jgi:hypothetical protein
MALDLTLQARSGFIFGGANQHYIVMYGLCLALGEVGPGPIVVPVATERFPTSIRGQMMGSCQRGVRQAQQLARRYSLPL